MFTRQHQQGRPLYSPFLQMRLHYEVSTLSSGSRITVWYHLRDAAVATIANGYFSTQILGDSYLVFKSLLTGNQSEMALQQLSADTQKQKVVTRVPWEGFPAGRWGYVSANQEGTRGALHVDQRVGACAIEGEKIRELWPVKTVRSNGCFRLHPTEDILWVGSSILEFSTGRETAVLELGDFEMFGGGIGPLHRRGDWVGTHHVVAPVLNKKTADLDQERKRFLARWDTRSGKLEDHVPATAKVAGSVSRAFGSCTFGATASTVAGEGSEVRFCSAEARRMARNV